MNAAKRDAVARLLKFSIANLPRSLSFRLKIVRPTNAQRDGAHIASKNLDVRRERGQKSLAALAICALAVCENVGTHNQCTLSVDYIEDKTCNGQIRNVNYMSHTPPNNWADRFKSLNLLDLLICQLYFSNL
jgi:hypothetical protein